MNHARLALLLSALVLVPVPAADGGGGAVPTLCQGRVRLFQGPDFSGFLIGEQLTDRTVDDRISVTMVVTRGGTLTDPDAETQIFRLVVSPSALSLRRNETLGNLPARRVRKIRELLLDRAGNRLPRFCFESDREQLFLTRGAVVLTEVDEIGPSAIRASPRGDVNVRFIRVRGLVVPADFLDH